jgi:hypothetical protein
MFVNSCLLTFSFITVRNGFTFCVCVLKKTACGLSMISRKRLRTSCGSTLGKRASGGE